LVLRANAFKSAVLEPESTNIDVHVLHGGFLRGMGLRGGNIISKAEVTGLSRQDDVWRVETPVGEFEAPVVVNAAGAWADVMAKRAGVTTVGLTPKRWTVILFDPPSDIEIDTWPLVIDADENWYFKPDAGKILASPADEMPVEVSDAQPDELDIALIADTIERITTMRVGRISHSRAGLRTFAPDKTPVVGFASDTEGFFWLAGRGGYGIETSPAMGVAVASLIVDGSLPLEFLEAGVSEADLPPRRFT
jgi:D-arginine dehydrogenase